MRHVMKKVNLRQTLAGILAVSLVVASSTAMASGRGYGGHGYSGGHYKHGYSGHRGYGSHNYGHRGRHYSGHRGYRSHRGHGGGGWVPFAVIGGLAAGYLISESANRNRYNTTTTYASSASYQGAASRPCHVVHKVDSVDGYEVKSAATMCYDARGYAYIVQGSEHVID